VQIGKKRSVADTMQNLIKASGPQLAYRFQAL
jgi:hypothetical protein